MDELYYALKLAKNKEAALMMTSSRRAGSALQSFAVKQKNLDQRGAR